ncbi:MAG: tRNA pseudouridine(55) synthase TruB [Acidimicrobiia bacterium]
MTRDGLVVVDKPAAHTSHDVVARIRRTFGQRRVGHAGTLDPDATGVLVVGLGRVTRLLRFVQTSDKAYRTDVTFGVATSTHDAAGDVLDREPMPVSRGDVEAAAGRFLGETDQLPPMVSAVKIGGRRLHDLARRGQDVERVPRRVRIDRLVLEEFEPGPYPVATMLVECGSGTYIRSLAADLGAALGGCAHVSKLRRLRVGSFTLAEARPLETIEAAPDAAVLPPSAAVRDLPALRVIGAEARGAAHGVVFPARLVEGAESSDGPFAVVDGDGTLLGVYERHGAALKPAVVVAPTAAPAEG